MTRTTTILATFAILALPGTLQAQDPADVAGGAGVWANTCVRCHNARPSTERTDAQWTVIVNHMRARANMTREEARLVTAFLQATNLPEGGEAVAQARLPESPAGGSAAPAPGTSTPDTAGVSSAAAPEGGDRGADEVGGGEGEERIQAIDSALLARLMVYLRDLRRR